MDDDDECVDGFVETSNFVSVVELNQKSRRGDRYAVCGGHFKAQHEIGLWEF